MSRIALAAEINPDEMNHFFYNENFTSAIRFSVNETLEKMCKLSCDYQPTFVAQKWAAVAHCSASVEMVSEDKQALLQLHFTDTAIMNIMSNMFGRAPLQMNNEVLDCVGSLTDVVYGRMRSLLKDQGYQFQMAIPKMFFTGKVSQPRGPEVRHIVIPFKVANSLCFAQLMFYI